MAPVRRRYASLYFIAAVDAEDNELLALQTIHFYVEVLDRYAPSLTHSLPHSLTRSLTHSLTHTSRHILGLGFAI